jgi:hypothetical protein
MLINAAKRPGRRSQNRHEGSLYELQSAQRPADSLMIDLVNTRIWGPGEPEETSDNDSESEGDGDNSDTDSVTILQTSGQATFATVSCTKTGGAHHMGRQYHVVWHSCTNVNLLEVPMTLLHF